ncbi:hypothetical protein HY251_17995 [bacterium]|nr:hypothetical protein [bacterium]
MDLTVSLAVEKVLYRLAILEGGRVALARAFVELPLAIEVLEQEGDKAADGSTIFKDSFGDFLCYEFLELRNTKGLVVPHDCPTCGRAAPESTRLPVPEGPVEPGRPAIIPGSLVCDGCYRKVARAAGSPDQSTLERIKHYFKGEDEEDPVKVGLVEHEIFYHALRLGGQELTHTAIAAQTRLPAAQVKERLERLAARKYIRQGLVPSGDALAYRFPQGLTYPEAHFRRSQGGLSWADETPKSTPLRNLLGSGLIRARPTDSKPIEFPLDAAPAPPAPPPAPKLNIKVKDTRKRGTPRPPSP